MYWRRAQSLGSAASITTSALPFTSYVAMSELLDVSRTQFTYL